jgi:hypothetical protein
MDSSVVFYAVANLGKDVNQTAFLIALAFFKFQPWYTELVLPSYP